MKYDCVVAKTTEQTPIFPKRKAFENIITEIHDRISTGEGFVLSQIRDHANGMSNRERLQTEKLRYYEHIIMETEYLTPMIKEIQLCFSWMLLTKKKWQTQLEEMTIYSNFS